MTEIKRYVPSNDDRGEGTVVRNDQSGTVVFYDDHAAIVAALQEQVRALAAENSALINSSVCTLQEGRPPYGFYASEWFIAKLKNGQYAALKALPEEYSHDYRTNDGTYYTKDWVVGWMQTPDTEYRPNVTTTATDTALREIQEQVQALAAEANYLRNEIKQHSTSVHFCEVCGKDDPCKTDDVCFSLNHPLPATDAALREIRAQAVEGFEKYCQHLAECSGDSRWIGAGRNAAFYANSIRSGEQP